MARRQIDSFFIYPKWAMYRAAIVGNVGLFTQPVVMPLDNMSGDASENDWQDHGPRGLLTELAESLSYLSSESRAERRRQKFRKDLVRVYIEDKKQSPSILRSVVDKLVKST